MVEAFNEPLVSVISVRDDPLLQQERSPHTSDRLREVIAQVRQRQTDLDESELSEMGEASGVLRRFGNDAGRLREAMVELQRRLYAAQDATLW